MTSPIDRAYVTIEPDVSKFDSQVRVGVNDALRSVESTATTMVNALEREFNQLGDQLTAEFRGIRDDLRLVFSGLGDVADGANRSIREEFVQTGASVDRSLAQVGGTASAAFGTVSESAQIASNSAQESLRDISRTSNHVFDSVKADARGAQFSVMRALRGIAVPAVLVGGVAAVGIGLSALTGFGLKAAAQLEQTAVSFNALTGSAEKGQAVLKELQTFAAATPFEFTDVAGAAKRFLAFNDAVGLTDNQLIDYITTIGNVASVTGGGAQAMNTVSLAMGQIASTGKVTLDNLNQISEAMPGFSGVAAIASAQGKTTAQVMQQISAGEISAADGIRALLTGMQKFPGAAGAMEAQSKTLLGVFSTFKDTVSQALAGAFAPVIPAIKDSLTAVTPILGDAIKQFAPILGGLLAQILPVVGKLVQVLVPILNPIISALGPALQALIPALDPLGAALGQIALVIAPILPLAAELIAALAEGLAPVVQALAPVIDNLMTGLKGAIEPLLPIIVTLGKTIGAILLPISQTLGQVFIALGPAIGQIVAALGTALTPLLVALAPVVTQLVEALLPLIPVFVELAPSMAEAIIALTPLIELLAQLLVIAADIVAPILKVTSSISALYAAKVVAPVIEAVAKALGAVFGFFRGGGGDSSGFMDTLRAIGGWFADLGRNIAGAFNTVVDFMRSLPGRIIAELAALPGQLLTLTENMMSRMAYAIGFGIGTIVKIFIALPGLVGAAFEKMWRLAVGLTVAGITAVVNFVRTLPGRLYDLTRSAWRLAQSAFTEGTRLALKAVTDWIPQVIGQVKALPGKIVSALGNLSMTLYQAGRDLIIGFIRGATGLEGWAKDQLKSVAQSAWKGFTDALGIGSPSKVAREAGFNTMQGYAGGVDDSAHLAQTSVMNAVSPAVLLGGSTHNTSSTSDVVTFGPGAIQINFNGATPTPEQARQIGATLSQSIIDMLNTRATRVKVRTA
jgi:tape measure domain-containing protein